MGRELANVTLSKFRGEMQEKFDSYIRHLSLTTKKILIGTPALHLKQYNVCMKRINSNRPSTSHKFRAFAGVISLLLHLPAQYIFIFSFGWFTSKTLSLGSFRFYVYFFSSFSYSFFRVLSTFANHFIVPPEHIGLIK